MYPGPTDSFGTYKHDCAGAACNYGCTPFSVSAGRVTTCAGACQLGSQGCEELGAARVVHSSSPHARMRQLLPQRRSLGVLMPLGIHAWLLLQEASPPFYLEREPGKHYIVLLDRGPSE